MPSIAAQEVAKEVISELGKSRKPILRKIAVKKGYSQHTADTPKNITETQSYKDIVEPYAQRLRRHQEKILAEMENKDLSQEQYRVLADSLTKITHDVQLLSGGATANIAVAGVEISIRK